MSPENTNAEAEAAARRELFAVLAHELRSPIGAILGFEELISEGILGEVPPRTGDALSRIRSSARQLLDLVAGLNDLATEPGEHSDTAHTEIAGATLVRTVIQALQQEAEGRGTTVEDAVTDTLPNLTTDAERAGRALQLALMAAIKASAGGTLRVEAVAGSHGLDVHIRGTRLDPRKDDPDVSLHNAGARLTGAGLRIAMARRALAFLNGSLSLIPDAHTTTLTVRLATPQETA